MYIYIFEIPARKSKKKDKHTPTANLCPYIYDIHDIHAIYIYIQI